MIKDFFMPEKQSAKQTYIWTVLAGLIYAGSSFLMQMVTSSYIGAAQAGILALALTVGNQLVTIGFYNIRTYQASDVREKYKFSDYLVLRLFTVFIMLAAGIVWVWRESYGGVKLAAVLLVVLFRAEEALSDVMEGRYQQKGRYDVSCRDMFVKVSLYLAAFLLVLLLTKNLALALLALAAVYGGAVFFVDRQLIREFGGFSLRTSWRRQRALLFEGFPLFINAFLNAYIINAAKYAIDDFYDSETMGIFAPLYMMAFVVNMFASFVLKPAISVMAEYYVKGNTRAFMRLVIRQIAVVSAATGICIAGAYVMGIPVLSFLFGVDLRGYRGALILILVSGGFTALYQLFQYGIIIMRHQYSTFVCCGLTAVLTYFITPYLTKNYAVMGASASYAISIGFMSALFFAFFLYHLIKDRTKER